MLDNNGFDQWAGEYDESIEKHSNGYPFEGYYEVLGYIQKSIADPGNTSILDLGIGTGLLTYELYKTGATIAGADFSKQMIEQAKLKMPTAKFYDFDFRIGLPSELKGQTFDYIVSSYAFHHIDDGSKVAFICQLKASLNPNGKIMIADVAFETREQLESCRNASGIEWDEEEFYFIGSELKQELENRGLKANYRQISICAGVLEVY